MAKLVLASGSPRRQELLERIGLKFTVRVPEVEERLPEGLNPRETVEALSRRKAAAADLAPDEIGIAADTMVFLDGKRLGKPADEAEALFMLTALQGRRHIVCTGVTVRQRERLLTESEETAVWFRPAGQEELNAMSAPGNLWIRREPTASRAGGPCWRSGLRETTLTSSDYPCCV